MDYVFCIASVVPIRKEPSHRSEMVSQLLLGETARIISIEEDFVSVETSYDGYEGWIQKKQIAIIDHLPKPDGYFTKSIQEVLINNNSCRVSIGTPYYNATIVADKYHIGYPSLEERSFTATEKNLRYILEEYIHTPYLWGGKSAFGIDCSGLTQQLFKILGIYLPRDTYQQVTYGTEVPFLSEAKCGDIAFFDNDEGRITHVGVLTNNSTIIHASGMVRIDKIDMGGIIHTESGERTHKLRIVKRLIKEN